MLNANAALAELMDLSSGIRCVALLDGNGQPVAATGPDAPLAEQAKALWRAADDAARQLGRPPVSQCEVGLPDALVFAVRERGYSAVAVTAAEATAGLIFYDLRSTLRSLSDDDDARS